jgi:cob(I)alamin adenosyltransferase
MIYSIIGYGKMKTESAIGISIRAIENGEQVLFTQFLKDGSSLEINFFKKCEQSDVLVGQVSKITLPQNITQIDRFNAQCLFVELLGKIQSKKYNLVVADEILPAIDMGLITHEQMVFLVDKCNSNDVDLFMTGRVRDRDLRLKVAKISNICTDARCVTHNFNTKCCKCGNDHKYYYTYCPDCGEELVKSEEPKKGRDY